MKKSFITSRPGDSNLSDANNELVFKAVHK